MSDGNVMSEKLWENMEMDIVEEKWQDVIEFLKKDFDIGSLCFDTWIKPLKIGSVKNNKIYIQVSSDVWVNFLEKKYQVPLQLSIKEIVGEDYQVVFYAGRLEQYEENIPLHEKFIGRRFGEKYTFESFVVGASNRFAYAVARAVAEAPGEVYNPLFIYGETGLGKTHLLQAIGNEVSAHNCETKVLYTTSENFTNELIRALKQRGRSNPEDTMDAFRNKYREVDVLLIDDIQFISGKESTQEEFFHTFNHLHMLGKQIVISSDQSPKYMKTLEKRLKTRFEGGVIADIGMPEYETRRAVIEKMIERERWARYNVSDETIDYLAKSVTGSIRELEGAMNKLVAYFRLNNQEIPIDLSMVKEVLHYGTDVENKPKITPEYIMEIVAQHYGITPAEIKSKKRDRKIVIPRHITMYLLRKKTDLTLEAIGMIMGKRNYSTVKYAIEKIEEDVEKDGRLKESIELLEKMIGV